jgi:hypothetical protein
MLFQKFFHNVQNKKITEVDNSRGAIRYVTFQYGGKDFEVLFNPEINDNEGIHIIDFFGGMDDLKHGMLRTPLDCKITFDDDPLRILRAIRFSITKKFSMSRKIIEEIYIYDYDNKMSVVSTERIREELFKCFKHDTIKTLNTLDEFYRLRDYIFKNNILWLKPTLEQ